MFGRKQREQRGPIVRGEIATLRPRAGDKIILKSHTPVSEAVARRIKQDLVPCFPDNEILVLDKGMDIVVVSDGNPTDPGKTHS